MPFAGIVTRNGIVRGSGPIAAVRDQRKRRAVLEARSGIVNAWQRRIVLGDTKAVARAEETLNRVYVECYGRLPARSEPARLSPREIHKRQVNARLQRLTAQSEALRARRPKKQISAGRITNSARSLNDPGSGDLGKLADMLMQLKRDNSGFGPIT